MGRTWVIATTIPIVGKMLSIAAQEQSAQWCAYFSGGPVNCGFATFEECLKAIHGKTGLCQQYLPPAESNPGSSGKSSPFRPRTAEGKLADSVAMVTLTEQKLRG